MNPDEPIILKLTNIEALIVRACVRMVEDKAGLSEIFPDQDDDADHRGVERPTVRVTQKLAVYHYPDDDDDAVLAAIRKAQETVSEEV